MDLYVKQLIEEENKKLEVFLESALKTIHASRMLDVKKMFVTKLDVYERVLCVEYYSNKKGFINISSTSIPAIARELFNYIYTGKAQGFIKNTYGDEE